MWFEEDDEWDCAKKENLRYASTLSKLNFPAAEGRFVKVLQI